MAPTRVFTFDGRKGNLDHQLSAAGYPFYSSYSALSALRDHITEDIEANGPMIVVVKHSEEGSGRFVRWLRDSAADNEVCVE